MDLQGVSLRPNPQAFVDWFVEGYLADDRIVAAFLGGSDAKGYADAYSVNVGCSRKDRASLSGARLISGAAARDEISARSRTRDGRSVAKIERGR